MSKLFRTDGIRGVANTYPMTPEMMVKIGLVVGKLFSQSSNGVIIGRDSRLSGQMLECALSSGLAASGINVAYLSEDRGVKPMPEHVKDRVALQLNRRKN